MVIIKKEIIYTRWTIILISHDTQLNWYILQIIILIQWTLIITCELYQWEAYIGKYA